MASTDIGTRPAPGPVVIGRRRPAGVRGARTLRRKALRDIRRARGPFAAIALTVLVGVALFVASFDAYRNLSASYQRTYDRLRFADLTITAPDAAAVADALGGLPEVEALTVRTQVDVPAAIGPKRPLARIIGLPADGSAPAVNAVDVVDGEPLSADRPTGALLERHAADHFDVGPGDVIGVAGASGPVALEVVGVAVSPEFLWPARSRQEIITDPDSFAVLFVGEPVARALGGLSHPNQVAVLLAPGAGAGAVDRVAEVARAVGATDVMTADEQPSNAGLQEDVDGFAGLALTFPLLFLAAAAIGAYVLLTRRVQLERAVIGTLRAAGASRGAIVGHYLTHGLVVGLGGAVAGVLVGLAVTAWATRAYVSVIGAPDVVVARRPVTIVGGLVFGLVVGVAGGWFPARGAARVPPAEAMRGVAPVLRPPGRWDRTVGRARWLPAVWRMALRGLGRARRRTAATVTGAVLALVLIVSVGSLIDSSLWMLHVQFDEVQRDDAQLVVDPAVAGAVLAEVSATDGVAAAEPGAAVAVVVSAPGGTGTYPTVVMGWRPDTTLHGFRTAGGVPPAPPPDGVLAGRALGEVLGVAPGDTLTLAAEDGTVVTMPLVGFVDEPLGTLLHTTDDRLRSAFAGSPSLRELVVVRYADGADRDALESTLGGIPGVLAVVDSRGIEQMVDQYLGLFWVMVGMMAAFGGLLAFTVIFVTMTVTIAERVTELATLRAAGVPVRRIGALIGYENLAATVIGVPLGLGAGWLAAKGVLASYSSDLFRFDLHLRPLTVVLAVAAVLIAAALSQIPALRAIRRLEVARVVRERAA